MSGERDDPEGSTGPDHDRTVREIRARFLRELPDRLATLRRFQDESRPGPEGLEAARELQRQAHNLVGTASSLGLPVLSDPARRLEELTDRWIEAGRVPEDGPAAAGRHLAALEERYRELVERRREDEPG